METMIAFCGLYCGSCPIHLATLEQDNYRQQSWRESIAQQCSELYGMTILAGDVSDCDGCRANTGRLFTGCLHCEIRNCASQKAIESCASCNEYPCELLSKHFLADPHAKNRLEQIRLSN